MESEHRSTDTQSFQLSRQDGNANQANSNTGSTVAAAGIPGGCEPDSVKESHSHISGKGWVYIALFCLSPIIDSSVRVSF